MTDRYHDLIHPLRSTADSSLEFRERTGIDVARSTSSADLGNLAAATKNSTFMTGGTIVIDVPRSQSTASVGNHSPSFRRN